MSQPSNVHHISQAAADNEDGVNILKIVIVGVVSLVIFALSAVVAWWVLVRDESALRARGVAPQVTGLAKTEEVGIIDYVPFDGDRRLEHWRADKAQALHSYGWVDRKKGVVHIPIEEAMKEVVRQSGGGGPDR
jgi:hypothetical protein